MNESEEKSPPKAGASNALSTPLAIVVAGGLIALALYFGSGRGNAPSTGTGSNDAGTVTGTEDNLNPQVAERQAGVGDFQPVSSEDHIRGAENPKVVIIEYSDLECPFCKRFHETMMQVLKEYPDDVAWVYRHFPLTQLHSKAEKEAVATECAAEQGKFWELTDKIFEVTPSNDGLDLNKLPELAQQAGVQNVAQFESCLDSDKYADDVQADLVDATTAGGQGTPYSIAVGPDGQTIPINGAQPFAQVKATIDSLL